MSRLQMLIVCYTLMLMFLWFWFYTPCIFPVCSWNLFLRVVWLYLPDSWSPSKNPVQYCEYCLLLYCIILTFSFTMRLNQISLWDTEKLRLFIHSKNENSATVYAPSSSYTFIMLFFCGFLEESCCFFCIQRTLTVTTAVRLQKREKLTGKFEYNNTNL